MVPDKRLYERFRNRNVYGIHRQMVAAVGHPAERGFGKISRSYNERFVFVRKVHENLRAFARLCVFVHRVVNVFIAAYVF